MLELDVYAGGVRPLNKILERGPGLATLAGLRFKVDRNHDLEPRFIAAVPNELRPRIETQPSSA